MTPDAPPYDLAVRLRRDGRPEEAARALDDLLAAQPGHAPALRLRGALATEAGQLTAAADFLRRAVDADPGDPHGHSLLGAALNALGRPGESHDCHRRALQLAPADPFVLNNLGVTLTALGKADEAADAFARALHAGPDDPAVLCNLAAARHAQRRGGEAEALYRKALALRPDLAQAHNNLGNLLRDRGHPEEARACYERALSLHPRLAEARHGLAQLLLTRGRLGEAVALYQAILADDPADAAALARLGHALLLLNRPAEALARCEEAVRLNPQEAEGWNNLGNARQALGEPHEAVNCYRQATSLEPRWPSPRYNRGVALLAQGRLREARTAFAEALGLNPSDAVAHSTAVGALHFDPEVDEPTLLEEHRRWAERHARTPPDLPAHANGPDPERPLRVGYVSPDLRGHVVARFLWPALRHHDPARVEAFCYSEVQAPDEATQGIRRLAQAWRDTAGLSDGELADLVRRDRVDVLVDLAGHTAGNRLTMFALEPAPVQVSYLGYPGTTGLEAVGYRIVDEVTDPPGEVSHHVEELVRLPGCFCCYAPPQPLPIEPEPPQRARGHVTFGSLHKLEKLNDRVIDLWGRLLGEVPGSRLLLARNTLRGATADLWRGRFAGRGLGPGRLEIVCTESTAMGHLGRYDRVDVALDCFPFGGHGSACEALWMGVPVVTLRGSRHAGRMVASVLTALGMPELIAETPEEYLLLAAELAADADRLAEMRATLRQRMLASPLCDGRSFTRHLEDAYRAMWRRWCASAVAVEPVSRKGREDAQPAPAIRPVTRPGEHAMTLRYLVGPVSAERAGNWAEPRRRRLCKAFNSAGTTDLAAGVNDPWDAVCRRLPADWRPDFVVLDLAYGTVPHCLWEAPVPLVALAPDWQLQWHYLRRALPRCDLILTDSAGVEVMRRQGLSQARPANLFGLEKPFRDVPPPDPGERDIDVLFVGNLHPAIHRERLPYLGRLARLSTRRHVLIGQGVHGEPYRRYLRRARIVFNRSVRGEWNRRVLEATSAGALLFQESGSRETAEAFRDRRECVYYTDDDLEELLEYYLTHEDERRAIAEAGRLRAQEFTFESLWEGVVEAVREGWPALQERARRRPPLKPDEALRLRAWQALGAADGGDPTLPDDLARHAGNAPLLNALGMVLALARQPEAAGSFHRALSVDSSHVVAAFNLTEALSAMGEKRLAAEGAQRLLKVLDQRADPGVLDTAPFPPGYHHLRVEWERAAWEDAGDPRAEARAKAQLLRWRLHGLLADLGDDLTHYHEAVLARPDLPTSRAALGCALGRAGRAQEAVPHLGYALSANPFDGQAARALSQALHDGGEPESARRLARERRLLRRAAPAEVPEEDWFSKAPPVGDELASVIVLCCNQVEYTRLCLESVLRHTRPPYELVLVDNGSTDGTPAYLDEVRSRGGPARVEVVRNETNVGYPAGCNQGLAKARGQYLVFLNNDTVVAEGWLEGLVKWALSDWPNVGMVGAVTNYSRPPQQVPADYASLDGMPAFAARRAREYAGQALRVERLTGFCLLARRDVLEKVGGYDEGYGLGFFDDDDLSVRVLKAGHHLLVAQGVFVHHFGSRTFTALGVDTEKQLKENFERFRGRWGEAEAAGYRLPGSQDEPPEPSLVVSARNGKPRVSLCMIVKDEEANLPACLDSADGLFDEVVVVDTGSADRTKELALSRGAKVFDFPWCDSFSAARNEGLEHATGDWAFWLDADDRLDEENREKLKALFASLGYENAAYSLKCRCLPDPVSNTATVVDHVRLFRNLPPVRWRYRVHEQILPAVRASGGEVRWSEVVIQHTGYADPPLRRRKLERDLRLLQLEYAEQPEDPFTQFNLGSVRLELGQPQQALPLLRRSLERSHPKDSIVRKLYTLIASCHMQQNQPDEALAACVEGRKVYPDDDELLYLEGALRGDRGELEAGKVLLAALLNGRPGQHFASVAEGLRGHKARHQLARIGLRQGQAEEAEAHWRAALAERPDFLPAWAGLGEMCLSLHRWDDVEQVSRRLGELPSGGPEAAWLRGRALLARKEFARAREVAEAAVADHPNVLGPRVLLSHALLQEHKDLDFAERALWGVLDLDPHNAEAKHNLQVLRAEKQQLAQDGAFVGNVALAQLYQAACERASDINEHLPTLYALARECEHVTEMGTRTGVSTTAFLHAQPRKLVCYDRVKYPQVDRLAQLAGGTEFVFHEKDVLWSDIEETDLLFIDTLHTYAQLTQELSLHAGKARRYIVLHDTTTFGEQGEEPGQRGLWPAVEEFLAQGTFRLEARYENNNGLAVLERVRAGAVPAG